MTCRSKLFGAVWIGGLLCGIALAAEPPAGSEGQFLTRTVRPVESKAQIERRLASISVLIERSSAARQIESSANPDALALRGKARELLLQADQAYQAGDFPKASQQLDRATKALYDGVRLADPWKITDAKKRRDFDAHMDSVQALLKAQKRISVEKHAETEEGVTGGEIETLIRDAGALAAANQLDQARAVLDQAYAAVMASLEGLRRGDTLVRTLRFASKEEEYRYELDRNDAHHLLANTLLKEKRGQNPGLESMMRKYLEHAARLRGEAASLAASGDFISGIKLQEDSTRELMRAIRGAGMNIP